MSSSQKEGFSFLLYLKGDCKALTTQPRALGQTLVGDPNVNRRCDLFPLAPGVGVVNHLCQEQVKQGSSYNKNLEAKGTTPFRRSQPGCPPCNLQGRHPGCSLATGRLPLSQGPRSGGLSESHFEVICLLANFVKYIIESIFDEWKALTCGKELTTWGLRFKPEGRPLLKGRLFPAGRA